MVNETGDKYKFPCGCEWDVLGPPPREGALPRMRYDYRDPPMCQAVVDLLASGRTKGLWQLESNLGKRWARKIRATVDEEVFAILALIRPGTLDARDENGVSMTEHYALRKHGLEPVPPFNPVVDGVLSDTYSIVCYQEQTIELCRVVAGFTEAEADMARRAVGKKSQEEMAKVRTLFMEKAKGHGVLTEDQAVALFDIIQKSSMYAFNRAHSCGYGRRTVKTAYLKAHHPVAFYKNWLKFAHLKADGDEDVAELVEDALAFGVRVRGPDLRRRDPRVTTDGVDVWLGLADVKGVGEKQIAKLTESVAKLEKAWGVPLDRCSWPELLFLVLDAAPATAIEPLIASGAFGWTGVSRKRQSNEFQAANKLSNTEWEYAKLLALHAAGRLDPSASQEMLDSLGVELTAKERRLRALRKAVKDGREVDQSETESLAEDVSQLRETLAPHRRLVEVAGLPRPELSLTGVIRAILAGGLAEKRRVPVLEGELYMLENPPASEEDTPEDIASLERKYLGVCLSATKLDGRDTSAATGTVAEYLSGAKFCRLALEVREVIKRTTKKGDKMAVCSVADQTGVLPRLVVFPDLWKETAAIVREGNTILVDVAPDNREPDAAIAQRIFQL